MSVLTHVIGTDHEGLYIDGELLCEAYTDELWSRDYVLDVVDEYHIEEVKQAYSPGTTNFPDTLKQLKESDEYKFEMTNLRKRDSIAND